MKLPSTVCSEMKKPYLARGEGGVFTLQCIVQPLRLIHFWIRLPLVSPAWVTFAVHASPAVVSPWAKIAIWTEQRT